MESDQKICPDPSRDDHRGIQASVLVSKLAVLCDHSGMAEVWLPPPVEWGRGGAGMGLSLRDDSLYSYKNDAPAPRGRQIKY